MIKSMMLMIVDCSHDANDHDHDAYDHVHEHDTNDCVHDYEFRSTCHEMQKRAIVQSVAPTEISLSSS